MNQFNLPKSGICPLFYFAVIIYIKLKTPHKTSIRIKTHETRVWFGIEFPLFRLRFLDRPKLHKLKNRPDPSESPIHGSDFLVILSAIVALALFLQSQFR